MQTVIVTQVVEVEVTREVAVTVTSRPATATPASTPTPRATRTATPTPVGGKWKVDVSTSAFDDSPTVFFALDAESSVTGPFATFTPTMIVRCQEGEIEVYVDVGMAPDITADNLDGAFVRLRYDDASAETVNTGRSTDDLAVFFEGARAMVERLNTTDRLLFEFTPLNGSPQQTSFDTRGLGEILPQLYEACPA